MKLTNAVIVVKSKVSDQTSCDNALIVERTEFYVHMFLYEVFKVNIVLKP